ncbi:hypothetical protein ACHAXS_002749 [Conticribra weissflogii]
MSPRSPATAGGSATTISSTTADDTTQPQIPLIDFHQPPYILRQQLFAACSSWGFFQLINHDIPSPLLSQFREAMSQFFSLPYETKLKLKRNANNARGYFDDELTKRRRDWKECLDVGVPGSREWSARDDADCNSCLDGKNRFPAEDECPKFRDVVVRYFEECARLSNELAVLMAGALGVEDGMQQEMGLVTRMVNDHTSYLRMNHYPPCNIRKDGETEEEDGEGETNTTEKNPQEPPPLGISPHRDAGFLTVLLQDDDCHSLQVARFEDEDHRDGNADCWVTVHPVPGAVTINTGDMAMIWSNGRFRAPLHRVLTDPTKERYSAPFFYNPGYNELISPLPCCCRDLTATMTVATSTAGYDSNSTGMDDLEPTKYQPCLWGYFRAVRFAGDLTDLGVEIQTSHYKVDAKSFGEKGDQDDKKIGKEKTSSSSKPMSHVEKQMIFLKSVDFGEAFDVDKYRDILQL